MQKKLLLLVCIFGIMLVSACENNKKDDNEFSYLEQVPYENVKAYYDTITLSMLDACDKNLAVDNYDEFMDVYANEQLVFLNEYQEFGLQLYGISSEDGNEQAMILRQEDSIFFVECGYRNLYYLMPELNCGDIDSDGELEVAISVRYKTGNMSEDRLCVCEFENVKSCEEIKNSKICDTYRFEQQDYLDELDARISCEFIGNEITIYDNDKILCNKTIDNWNGGEYVGIAFSEHTEFDVQEMKFRTCPDVYFEDSIPVSVCDLWFDIHYEDGKISLGDYAGE